MLNVPYFIKVVLIIIFNALFFITVGTVYNLVIKEYIKKKGERILTTLLISILLLSALFPLIFITIIY
jgi:hypothetical protein